MDWYELAKRERKERFGREYWITCIHGKYYITKTSINPRELFSCEYLREIEPEVWENFGDILIITVDSVYYLYLPIWSFSGVKEGICHECSECNEELINKLKWRKKPWSGYRDRLAVEMIKRAWYYGKGVPERVTGVIVEQQLNDDDEDDEWSELKPSRLKALIKELE